MLFEAEGSSLCKDWLLVNNNSLQQKIESNIIANKLSFQITKGFYLVDVLIFWGCTFLF